MPSITSPPFGVNGNSNSGVTVVGSAVHSVPDVNPAVSTRPDRCRGVVDVEFVPGEFVAQVQ
jgi:hypothetical protein